MASGAHDAHIAALAKGYEEYEGIDWENFSVDEDDEYVPIGGEVSIIAEGENTGNYFNDSRWDTGVVYIDLEAYAKENGWDEEEEDEDSGDGTEKIKAPYDKYFGDKKALTAMDVMGQYIIGMDLTRDEMNTILDRMKADGYEFADLSAGSEEMMNLQGGKEPDSAVMIIWSEGTATFMFTTVPEDITEEE